MKGTCKYQKFHNIFYHDEIRADQKRRTEVVVGIHYYPYAMPLLPRKSQKLTERDVWYIFKTTDDLFSCSSLLEINILFRIMNYLVSICFEAE